MQGIVLVGGEGTRLRPLTYDVPKPMLPIVEGPIIARVLEWLGHHGVTRVALSLGYEPGPFFQAFPDQSWAGVEICYAVEPHPLDTAGAALFAAEAAGMLDEPVLVFNGDILTDLDLGKLIALHEERDAAITLALTPVEDPSPYGVVVLDAGRRVLSFVEKPPRGEAPSNLINAGSYVFEPRVFAGIAPGRPVSVERETLPYFVGRGEVYAYDSDAYWIDTGTPERYVRAQLDVLAGLRPNVVLPACERRAPGVFVAPEAVLEGEVIGCAFLGAGAVVEAGARVTDAVLGPATRVMAGATVRGSVVLSGARVAPEATVDSSIVGPRAVVGSGARLLSWTVIGAGFVVDDDAVLVGAHRPG
ncbi:MAG TPA: NDP-sugar synthase [Acidimicrobiales bacterium]|nr:NDP-sugar synthase [Acidimicrobiales bacterium]